MKQMCECFCGGVPASWGTTSQGTLPLLPGTCDSLPVPWGFLPSPATGHPSISDRAEGHFHDFHTDLSLLGGLYSRVTTHPCTLPAHGDGQDPGLAPTLSPAMHRMGLSTLPLGTRLGPFSGLKPPGTHSTFFFFFFCICESGSLVEAFLAFFFFSFFSLSFFSKGRK